MALHAGLQLVVDEFGGDPLDRFLACGVDVAEHHLVEQAQAIGEIFVEVAGAGVEVGLEHGRHLAVLVEFAYALRTLVDLHGVVGIVAQHHMAVVFHLEVETAVHTTVGGHPVAQLAVGAPAELGHGHGGHGVLDVDGHRLSKAHVVDPPGGRDEVEGDFSVVDDDVLGMEVTLVAAVVEGPHALAHLWLHLQSAVDDECASGLDERGVVAETLEVGLFCAVDVEMVGVGGSDA